jgi:hypothetical protein
MLKMIHSNYYRRGLRLQRRALKAVILSGLALALGCGGGSAPGGGGPPPETATISKTIAGPFNVAMSTSFQPAEWDYTLFQDFPNLTTTLGNLQPQHIRLQGISQGVPQGKEGKPDETWNFTILDAITQPVLGVGDHSPEFQIAKAPPFMYVNNDSSQPFVDTTFKQFAGYAQNLVQYYDTGGFTADGTKYVSPAYPGEKITWWGIYNEPSINNNLQASDYVNMYNALVPAMQSTDSSLKFVAMELCCGSEDWVTTFAQNVNAPVDVVASHYYSSCDQKDTDAMLMGTVPGFVSSVQTIRSNLSTNPALASVPIWVTENNVNADFDAGNGMSACNPGQPFVTDLRGSSAFFAAWRPYVFSQLGKTGMQALYHWDFGADAQYGEVNATTGQTQLSYWVDYWLQRMFPSPPGTSLLDYTASDNAELEVLPVLNGDGSVVVMVANHAVNSPQDNNGPGVAKSIQVDVSALGTFSSGSLLMIDASTNAADGPTPTSVTPAAQSVISFDGYGVAFLTLKP